MSNNDIDFDCRTDPEVHPEPVDRLSVTERTALNALDRLGFNEACRRPECPLFIGITMRDTPDESAVVGALRMGPFHKHDTSSFGEMTTDSIAIAVSERGISFAINNPGVTIAVLSGEDHSTSSLTFLDRMSDVRIEFAITPADMKSALLEHYSDLAGVDFDLVDGVRIHDLLALTRIGASGPAIVRGVNRMAERRLERERIRAAESAREKSSRAKTVFQVTEPTGVRVSDLPGFGTARTWALRIASELQAYLAGDLAWEDIDRGALLVGPPGSGKSTLMRALAAEAGVPMLFTGFAEFSAGGEGHMGTILKGIRALFEEAQQIINDRRVVIVAIDEIDSIQPRGVGLHADYWGGIVNALLAEINGRPGLIVVGTSNSKNVDPALIRPGRMDRIINIPNPARDEIGPILRHHLGGAALDTGSAIGFLIGCSAADLEQVAKSARRRARMAKRELLQVDVIAAIEEIRPPIADPEVAMRAAVHEAGHAVAQLAGPHVKSVELTIREDLAGSGVRCHENWEFQSLGFLSRRLVELLAGRVAEQRWYGGAPSRGSGGGVTDARDFEQKLDLRRATDLALEIETQHGVGVTGLLHVPSDLKSALLHPEISRAVRDRLARAHAEADELLAARWHQVEALAHALVRERYLSADRVAEIAAKARLKRRPAIDPEDEEALAHAL